ncbi:putative disease resistance protein RGA4 [Triticum dicoccoides]|nr:putative disease resistance protein RGA4 [Triticum dicoccoides]
MATVLDGLVSSALHKLAKLVEDEVMMTLCVGRDIKKLQHNLEAFRAVRQDAEAMAMRDKRVRLWWKRVSDVMFNVDDVIDLFMANSYMRPRALPCSSMFSCFAKLLLDHRVATRIKDINTELGEIRGASEMYNNVGHISQQTQITAVDTSHTIPIVGPGIVGTGITRDVDSMVQAIASRCPNNDPSVFGIEGMGGIGKTTLAKKIYWEEWIRKEFQIHIWLGISETYDMTGLLKQAIRMAGGNCDQRETEAELLLCLKDTIQGKSVFLVLDNVFRADVWIRRLQLAFEGALNNVCVLVTTRSHDVLLAMGTTHIHSVSRMSEDDGLMLLMKNSFQWPGRPGRTFQELGRQIVRRCDGLPLAIKAVAGTLSTRKTEDEWKKIRDCQWSIEGLPEGVGGALYVSYRNLADELKQCFLWCALLPQSFEIRRDAVAYWWVAEGFVRKEHGCSVHQTAEGYYYELVRRNLLQPTMDSVDLAVSTMHDVLRSLGQHLTKDHSLFMNVQEDYSRFMDVENNGAVPKLRRLGISSAIEELPAIEEHKSLRTLLIFDNKKFSSFHNDTFKKLQHVRVLVLRGTSIENIPESLGNMVLLRLLDLSYTEIEKLPESIGNLISLEYLRLLGCPKLHSLPHGLMRLSNISFLELDQLALHDIPKGIARFKHLYNLRGVFETKTGFRLDELQDLPNIQRLWVDKLEKATPEGELVLKNSSNLRELGLQCTSTRYEANELERIQQVYDRLIPSPSLVYLFFVAFPCTMFPKWLRTEPELNMPILHILHLNESIPCTDLPPAGQIPELLELKIQGADEVVSIGTDLLGKGVPSAAAFFPKLELLLIIRMYNLEKWYLNPRDQQLSLMPCLQRLLLLDCPKLTALPPDLSKMVSLKRIHIEGAHELKEVVNLPAVAWLKLKNNKSLTTISNLCKLQDLFAQDCPMLDRAENLCLLKHVYMIDCPHALEFRNCLPGDGVLFHVATDGHNIFPDEAL